MMQQVQPDMELPHEGIGPTVSQSNLLTIQALYPPSRSAEVDKLVAALAKAQGAFPEIERNRTVRVRPKSGGQEYEFKYATLSAIIDAIRKPLSENGLAYTQIISHDADSGFYVLTTTLYCGNQFLSSKTPIIIEGQTNQQFGSALTYMKRYALAAILGIAAEEDDDANIADGNEIKGVVDKAPKAPAPDPISSGLAQRKETKAGPAADNLEKVIGPIFSPELIKVPLLPDESGSDWMAWGQAFMAAARSTPDVASLVSLEKENEMPITNMRDQAPKMFTNMTLALIKVKKALEKATIETEKEYRR